MTERGGVVNAMHAPWLEVHQRVLYIDIDIHHGGVDASHRAPFFFGGPTSFERRVIQVSNS